MTVGVTESPTAATGSEDCGSVSKTDSGAGEFDRAFPAGEVTVSALSIRDETSGTGTLVLAPLLDDESFEPIFGAAGRLPVRREDPAEAPPLAESALADSPPDRPAPRAGRAVDVPEGESALDPVEPEEPVVSAAATGTDAIAEPTPRATANAPTRPTYRAYPDATDSLAIQRLSSIGRTWPAGVRR